MGMGGIFAVIAVIAVLFCSFLGYNFAVENNGSFEDRFRMFFLWILGFPGALIGTIVRKTKESKEEKRKEKNWRDNQLRRTEFENRVKANPVLQRIAADIAAKKPLLHELEVTSFAVGPLWYSDYGMSDIPNDYCDIMAHALAETAALRGKYHVSVRDEVYKKYYLVEESFHKQEEYAQW